MQTIAYKYRILRVLSDERAIMDEIRAGHRLYNDLVAIERKRRAATEAFWAERGGYQDLLAERGKAIEFAESIPKGDDRREEKRAAWRAVNDLRKQIWECEKDAIKAFHASDPVKIRRMERAKELRAAAKARKEKLTAKKIADILDEEPDCLTERDKLRKTLIQSYKDRGVGISAKTVAGKLAEAFPGPTEHVEQEAKAAAYTAYRERGVTPGTRAVAADAHERSLEMLEWREQRFKPWSGHGAFGTQIQGGATYGDLCSGSHTFAQLECLDRGNYTPGSRRHGSLHRLRVRLGSDGQKPVWAEFEASLLRSGPRTSASTSDPIPPDARVMQVRVVVDRIGVHDHWYVCFTAQVPDAVHLRDEPPTKGGTVAIDIGWRSLDGGLRVGYFHDGQEHGPIDLPTIRKRLKPHGKRGAKAKWFEVRDVFDHASHIQGILSQEFYSEDKDAAVYGGALHDLAVWIDSRGRDALPEWLSESTAGIRQWRSQARLNGLVERWLHNRFEGDGQIVARMDQWRKDYRHLHEWCARERNRALNARDEHYRQTALRLARAYETIVINGADLATTRRRKRKEKAAPELVMVEDAKRSQAFGAAPGKLREEIVKAAKKYGRTLVKLPFETERCHVCGEVCEFDRARYLSHKCEHEPCTAQWDQDANACLNALREWSGGAKTPGTARKRDKPAKSREKTTGRGDAIGAVSDSL
jgi:hypothetical protein